MIYVELPERSQLIDRRLGFYLAMEEFLAREYAGKDFFFMWQVDPTVICGRNQEVELETDLEYCRREGIDVIRRKSGGGCVFADRSNIMFSYICDSTDVTATFADYTGKVTLMLRGLGLDASDNSRNDILIGDRKVSGCAFYHLPSRSIVHGTMLYDTDMRHIANALTPSKAKLQSKGVKSVKSRITTIKEHLPNLSIEEFKQHSRQSLCGDRTLVLDEKQIEKIEALELGYYDPVWTFRDLSLKDRRLQIISVESCVEGVGQIKFDISLDAEGKISSVSLYGDFFQLADAEKILNERLRGVYPTETDLKSALEKVDLSKIIVGLSETSLITTLTANMNLST